MATLLWRNSSIYIVAVLAQVGVFQRVCVGTCRCGCVVWVVARVVIVSCFRRGVIVGTHIYISLFRAAISNSHARRSLKARAVVPMCTTYYCTPYCYVAHTALLFSGAMYALIEIA